MNWNLWDGAQGWSKAEQCKEVTINKEIVCNQHRELCGQSLWWVAGVPIILHQHISLTEGLEGGRERHGFPTLTLAHYRLDEPVARDLGIDS